MNRATEIIDESPLSVCPDRDHLRGRRGRDVGRGIDCSDAPGAGLVPPASVRARRAGTWPPLRPGSPLRTHLLTLPGLFCRVISCINFGSN